MKALYLKFLLLFLLILLSGCAALPAQQQESAGLSQQLSALDQKDFNQKMNTILDDQSISWQNDDNTARYQLSVQQTHVNDSGAVCRNYSLVIDKNYARKQIINSLACRNENGSWINNPDETN